MINRTKICVFAVAAALAAAALTGCGGSSSSSAPASSSELPASSVLAEVNNNTPSAGDNSADALDSAVSTLLAANPISNQLEIDAVAVEYDFGLKAEDVVSYKGVKSNDNGDAGLVLVIEAADGKAEDIVASLTNHQQDLVAYYGNYAEFAQAQANVENAIISSDGSRVVMVIASNDCTADLSSAVDSVMNG